MDPLVWSRTAEDVDVPPPGVLPYDELGLTSPWRRRVTARPSDLLASRHLLVGLPPVLNLPDDIRGERDHQQNLSRSKIGLGR
jgi:hypothetical protein